MKADVLMIANARALGSSARWPVVRRTVAEHFNRPFDVAFTERPGHASELARQAIRAGYSMLVAVGGDGSVNEVLNGFYEGDRLLRADAVLGVLPYGTGNDFIRTLGIPRDLPSAARVLAARRTRAVDVGVAQYTTREGLPAQRYFINIAEFGAGGLVVEQVRRAPRFLSSRGKFLWAILAASLRYRNQPIRYAMDDQPLQPAIIRNFVVANGRFFGAGLCPAPQAEPDDGLLDVVCFGDFGAIEISWHFPQLLKGTHLAHPKVRTHRARHVRATAETPVLLELDGELVGRLPASFAILPQRLHVCVPPGSTGSAG